MLAPLREDERLPCAVKLLVDRGVVFPRLQRRSWDAERKDDKLASSSVFLVEAAAYVSCCCCCRSGRILGPIVNPGVDATAEVQRRMITVARLMMRIFTHGLAAQAFPAAEEEGGKWSS